MKNSLRKWLARLGILIIIIAGIFVSIVGRIDRTPLAKQDFYTRMMSKLATEKPAVYQQRNQPYILLYNLFQLHGVK